MNPEVFRGRKAALLVLGLGLAFTPGCVSVKTQHKIDPIHITMDVNLRLERELEQTFAELDRKSQALAEDGEKEPAE